MKGDANFDSSIGPTDLAVWQSQYGSDLASFSGATSSLVAAVHQVPEPSSAVLLAIALITATLLVAGQSQVGG